LGHYLKSHKSLDEQQNIRESNMAFGADKPFVMKIAYAIFPPSLRFAQAGLAAQKIVGRLLDIA
jgi:hypothetical protein